ncbi:hypothetical protein NDU88_003870 [Pleurodeles waltl]|uniref:Uncharacterized protein n=1 Tax=Pleurodeles waltl TaxID=8319 RepID=A0AAV7W866_PLEWA|nr:hypothetical protein NDU88_003870 [Pleurodeles waltl]
MIPPPARHWLAERDVVLPRRGMAISPRVEQLAATSETRKAGLGRECWFGIAPNVNDSQLLSSWLPNAINEKVLQSLL